MPESDTWVAGSGAKIASGAPKALLSTCGSASARFNPWQLICPRPWAGFSPWRSSTMVSLAAWACADSSSAISAGHFDNDSFTSILSIWMGCSQPVVGAR
ncbi:hypothetical protein [Chromobacterium violaceum]|uniref:hypothetical protein n=1 Tax=Chromobacterium violaceum TaxID=536 RepID=UPI0012FD0166|nr:hypothetical protein [Chromobacterium violaceum]